MPTILNGRDLAASLRAELKNKVAELNLTPRLGVILVGDAPASHLYVALKEKAAKEVGIGVEKILLPNSAAKEDIIAKVEFFNNRPDIHGILIQLPLPPQLNEHEIISAMNPEKDADGFHPHNLTNLQNNQTAVIPGVTAGIIKLIELSGQTLAQKQACLIVNSDEFALPLKKLLQDRVAKVNIIHTPEPKDLQVADIVVVALGQPQIIKGEFIKDGAVLIDVGTTKVNGKVMGDVDAASLANRDVYLTPVPGGVGPMTVIMLLWNVYHLARQLAEKTV
ncbi:MAG TPA: bifunctional methylenetetrahydrofolate dehydrogenase/methenyltetrahydrofolate cyclohydrolase [Candidatus Veblenbacteria bacterium]|nr:bifunctional methylenetetrahydrofolate dehydrogenase/methenyltetrahydrofolate cyclohydrolase [Candidatus Veblenbacteria bacterium]